MLDTNNGNKTTQVKINNMNFTLNRKNFSNNETEGANSNTPEVEVMISFKVNGEDVLKLAKMLDSRIKDKLNTKPDEIIIGKQEASFSFIE